MTKTPRPKTRTSKSRDLGEVAPSPADPAKTFGEHLAELRLRFLFSIGFLVVGTVVGYLLHQHILAILIRPLDQTLFYSSPAGGFDFVLKLSFLFGFVVSVPVIVYQVLRFIEPVLPAQSPKKMAAMLLASCALLIVGMLFAYFVSLPAALYFLNAFTTDEIQALISTTEYFSFVTRYLLGFGILFQLPLIMLVINSVQRLSMRKLMSVQKWVFLASFIVAAILTPTPDLFNQLIMAVPLILLYQVSIGLVWAVNGRQRE